GARARSLIISDQWNLWSHKASRSWPTPPSPWPAYLPSDTPVPAHSAASGPLEIAPQHFKARHARSNAPKCPAKLIRSYFKRETTSAACAATSQCRRWRKSGSEYRPQSSLLSAHPVAAAPHTNRAAAFHAESSPLPLSPLSQAPLKPPLRLHDDGDSSASRFPLLPQDCSPSSATPAATVRCPGR